MAAKNHSIQAPVKNSSQSSDIVILLNTVIVFDFDDTLFPTTRVNEIDASNYIPIPKESQELIQLSWVTYNLLLKYIDIYTKRNICIVTSSSVGWVENVLSLNRHIGYYGHIYDLLFTPNGQGINSDDKISIYYPSDNWKNCKYHDISLDPMTLYKYQTFVDIFNKKAKKSTYHHLDIVNTFVIIGDSLREYTAAKILNKLVESVYGKNNGNIFIDTIRLICNPSIDTLMKEQTVLYNFGQNRYYENYYSLTGNGVDIDFSEDLILHQANSL